MPRITRCLRPVLLAGLLASLAACGIPRSGPSFSEVTAPAPAGPGFDLVRVDQAVAAATRIDERAVFPAAFVEAAPEDTAALAPGDVVAITVWENIDQGLLNPQGIGATALPKAQVDGKGMVFVPYVGQVRAGGRSIAQLREAIRVKLAEQTLNPQVDIFPLETRGRVVSLQGRIKAPGLYPIEPPTARLLPMLARAGGVGEDPEVVRLKLRRGTQAGEIWVQDLYDDPRNDVALRPGDAVIAERDRRSFTALGSVGRQATVPFPSRDLSVAQAMGSVGGLADAAADPTGVFVFRQESADVASRVLPGAAATAERRIVYLIDLTQPGGMFLAREFLMRDGDTLYVTAAPFTAWMKVLQSVMPFVTFAGSARALTMSY